MWRGLGTTMVVAHFAFLAYLIIGGFVAWRWRATIVAHILAAIWGVLIVVTKVPCPLTSLQNNFRERGGQPPYGEGFIGHYVKGQLYPAAYERPVQAAVAVIVLASWVGFGIRGRHRRPVRSAAV